MLSNDLDACYRTCSNRLAMPDVKAAYDGLIRRVREISLLGSAASVLHWDERTQMPPKGAEHRSNQVSLIARLTHEQFTSPEVGALIATVESDVESENPESNITVNIRELRRSYDRQTKLPGSLVEELTKTEVLGQQAWAEARKKSDFALFKPWLEKIVSLAKQKADCFGYTTERYDALLDDFEPGDTASDIVNVFDTLRAPLIELVNRVASSGRTAPIELFDRNFPAGTQEQLSRDAARAIGFDFDAGRLDVSVHPFCTHLGPGDVRMTTRYNEGKFGAFFGVLHETGHALYSQGLPAEHYGTPLGEYVSLGIHESQSRMWENLVGRSRSFWQHFFPKAQAMFPDALRDVSLDQWLFAQNDIRPSLIRVEADEATYNLHILLRFELERAMMRDDLAPADIPGVWNETMRKYFDLTPPDDARGCLQDIHWSGGAIGYFPTYTLGNLYAAQFFEQARHDLGDLDAMFARGEFLPLLEWLRTNVHQYGRRYRARDLVKRVTGRDLSAQPLLDHLRRNVQSYYRT